MVKFDIDFSVLVNKRVCLYFKDIPTSSKNLKLILTRLQNQSRLTYFLKLLTSY